MLNPRMGSLGAGSAFAIGRSAEFRSSTFREVNRLSASPIAAISGHLNVGGKRACGGLGAKERTPAKT